MKAKMLLEILLRFLKIRSKTQVLSKKKGLYLESPLIYRFPPEISFSTLAEFFFVNFIIARNLEIVAKPHQNLK